MSEEASATDSGAELSTQSVDPVNAFEALLDKQIQPSGEQSDAPVEEPSDTEPELEAEPVEELEAEEKLYTVKIDGKEVQVTESELVANYQKGQAANQRFEQAAQERKAAQAEYQRVAEERTQALNSLHIAQQVLQSQIQEQPNWAELLQNDPVEYLQQRHAFEQKQAKLQEIQGQQWQLQQIQAREQEAQQQVYLENQRQMLTQLLPEWKDETKAQAESKAVKEYLAKTGYTTEEISSVADARAILLARKAMLYDQIITKAQETSKKVQSLPKVQRPGVTQNTDGRTKDMQALRKSGSTAAAASIFEKML